MSTWTKGDDAAVCLSYRDHGVKATPELLAALSHLTAGSIGMRLQNVEYLATGGAHGLSGVAKQTREIWKLVTAAQTVRDEGTYREIDAEPRLWTPLRILQGVRVLHQRGYHAARVLPGMSASGGYWRVSIAAAANFQTEGGYLELRDWDSAVSYSTGDGTEFAGSRVDASTSPDVVADLILSALPRLPAAEDDPVYVEWYAGLMRLVEEHHSLPIAYADYFDEKPGWEIGWGSGIRYPHPPPLGA